MVMHKIILVVLGISLATTLPSAPAGAVPVVLNPNFTENNTAANNSFNNGNLFFINNWDAVNYASNTNTDPAQYNNGNAGGRSVVGFLSGPSTSLSQLVSGFVVGYTYQVSVGANARSGQPIPTFRITAGGTQVYGPTNIAPVNATGVFTTAFTTIQSNAFVATNTSMTITFANAANSLTNGSTLLTAASIAQVPEPISLALLGMGLAGIGLARRRG